MLIQNRLHEAIFRQVIVMLKESGLILKKGIIVDFTIISAPLSTKNKEMKRDLGAHQTKMAALGTSVLTERAILCILIRLCRNMSVNESMTSKLLHGEKKT